MRTEILEEIGLTKSEIKVYLALLELGSTTTGPLVDKSKASSSKIYEILEKLIQKGLVSYIIKSGTKYYEAAAPSRILDYMKEKQSLIAQQTKEVEEMLPELESKRELKEKSETIVFKGIKGAETAFDDIIQTLAKGEELNVIGFSYIEESFQNFLARFHTKRAKNGIKCRLILGAPLEKLSKKLKKLPYTKAKLFSKEKDNPVGILTYKDKTLLSLAKDFIWIQIKNKRLTDSFRERFRELWHQETTVEKGFDALERALLDQANKLKSGDYYQIIGAALGTGSPSMAKKYSEFYSKIQDVWENKNAKAEMLFQQGTQKYLQKYRRKVYKGAKVKFLPYKTESPVAFTTSKSEVVFTIQEKEPTVVKIRNKKIAQAFHKNFDTLWGQDVNVYKGFEDVTNKFSSMLDEMEEGEEYQVLGASYGLVGRKLIDWFMKYHEERIKRKIHVKLLGVSEASKVLKKEVTETGDPNMKYSEVRILPPELSSPMQINLYKKNKILFFIWGKDTRCIEIESEILHDNFKKYFNVLWNQN